MMHRVSNLFLRLYRGWLGGTSALTMAGVAMAIALSSCSDQPEEPVTTAKERIWSVGWTNLGGGTTGPSLFSSGATTLDVRTAGGDANLWALRYSNGTWSSWMGAYPAPPGGINGVPAAAAFGDDAVLVARSPDNLLWWTYWTRATDTYAPWSAVGSWQGAGLGSPAVTTIPGATLSVRVFVRGLDNRIWTTSKFGTGAWSAWSDVGGAPPGGVSKSPAAVFVNGLHHLVVRAPDGSSWYRNTNGVNWSNFAGQATGWQPLGGVIDNSPALSTTATNGLVLHGTAPGNGLWTASRENGTWSGWSFQTALPAEGVGSSEHPVIAAQFRTQYYPHGRDVVVRVVGGKLYHRLWYDFIPMTQATAATQKTLSLGANTFEHTSLVIPPNKAGCGPNGALLVSLGESGPRMWRTSFACATGVGTTCSSLSDVSYSSANWPAVVQSPQDLAANGAASDAETSETGLRVSQDNQLVRFADGSILLAHQGVRRDAGSSGACTGPNTCRGTEYFFRSVDCGLNWSLINVLDTKSDGPAGSPSKYYNPQTQAAHDRIELYADPFNPTRVYATVMGRSHVDTWTVLYRSNDRGSTWTWTADWATNVFDLPALMTTAPSGRLYIVGTQVGAQQNVKIAVYDPQTGATSGPHLIATDHERHAGAINGGSSHGISRIGTYADGDYVRVHYPYRTTGGDYGMKILVVRISGATSTVISQNTYPPPAGKSWVSNTAVESDRLEWTENGNVNPTVIYWYEINTVASGGSYGPARLLYRQADDVTHGSLWCMSLSSGTTCRTWPTYTSVYGHYQKGSFWYDPTANQVGFLALWAEQNATNSVRVNLIKGPFP